MGGDGSGGVRGGNRGGGGSQLSSPGICLVEGVSLGARGTPEESLVLSDLSVVLFWDMGVTKVIIIVVMRASISWGCCEVERS